MAPLNGVCWLSSSLIIAERSTRGEEAYLNAQCTPIWRTVSDIGCKRTRIHHIDPTESHLSLFHSISRQKRLPI